MSLQTLTKMTDARSLFSATEDGDHVRVARLLSEGANADVRLAPGGETPLMRASARGHEEVARVLLDAGADVCARRADGFTPLILAVFFGHEGVVRLLVERGADASARTGLGTSAARWADARGFASMAELLRDAEAASRNAAATRGLDEATAASTKSAVSRPSDEVEIFSKNRTRRETEATANRRAGASVSTALFNAEAAAGREEPAIFPATTGSAFIAQGESSRERGASDADADVSAGVPPSSDDSAEAGVSVRRGGRLASNPSASAFRLGPFLRSWQGSAGVLLLLIAAGLAAFTFLRGGVTRQAMQPAPMPAPVAPQAAAPLPTMPQPTPAFPTPDPLGVVPDQTYAVPNAGGQPYYIQQGPVAPVPSDVPRELTVVSENGSSSGPDAPPSRRGAGANANESAPARPDASTREGGRDDNKNTDAAARAARTPEPEPQRPASPPNPSGQPPSTAPQPTPGRAKVIQWPPQ